MVLRTLVEAISQSLRDPHNLLHMQLVQSLKRDISHDVTEAFTESRPLIDEYPDLYRQSSSFLDFLFKLCHAPLPPAPLVSYSEGLELETCKKKIWGLEQEIQSLKEVLTLKNISVGELEAKLQLAETNLSIKEQKVFDLETSLDKCLQENTDLKSQPNAPLGRDSLTFTIRNDTLPEGNVTFPPEEEKPSQPLKGLFPLQPLEYQPSDLHERHVEEQDKLSQLLNNFKEDTLQALKVSDDKLENLEQLLKKYFPNKDSTDVACTSSESADTLCETLFAKLEEYFGRLLDEKQLAESVKLFDLDRQFAEFNERVQPLFRGSKKNTFDKFSIEVTKTKNTVKNMIKSVIQKVSTMFGSKLPSLVILERLDELEKSLFCKTIQLERFMEEQSSSKPNESENQLKSENEDLKKKLQDVLSKKADALEQRLEIQTSQIHGLQTPVMTRDHHIFSAGGLQQQLLNEDKRMATQNFSNLIGYLQSRFPDIGYKMHLADEVISLLNDYLDIKKYINDLLKQWNVNYYPTEKLVLTTQYIIGNLINSASQNTQNVQQMENICQRMLSLTDANTKYLTEQSQNAHQTLIALLQETQKLLERPHFSLTESQLNEFQNQLEPKNVNPQLDGTKFSVEEVDDDMNGRSLPLQCSGTTDRENLIIERDDWKQKFYVEAAEVRRIQSSSEECNAQLENLMNQCQRLVENFNINTFLTDMEQKIDKNNKVCEIYFRFCNSLAEKLHIPLNLVNWNDLVINKFNGISSEKNKCQSEIDILNNKIVVLQQNQSACYVQLTDIQTEMEGKNEMIKGLGQTIKVLQADKASLEERCKNNESELERIQSDYDQERAKLKRQLLCEDKTKELTTKLSAASRKRQKESSESESDDNITKNIMKQLFIVFYVRYFKILYKHKWVKLSVITEDLKNEIRTKLDILTQIKPTLRKSFLLDILLKYVTYELRLIENYESTLGEYETETREIDDLNELVDYGIKTSVSKIEQLLATHSPLPTETEEYYEC